MNRRSFLWGGAALGTMALGARALFVVKQRGEQEVTKKREDEAVPALQGAAQYHWIVNELTSQRPLAQSMSRLIDGCEAAHPHRDWARLRELPYADLSAMIQWLRQTFAEKPPAEEHRGLWFGLSNPVRKGKTVADVGVCACKEFDADSPDAAWTGTAGVCGSEAESNILADIYRIACRKGDGVGNHAEYPLCLGYTAFAVRDALRALDASFILGKSKSIGVAVGFVSGDIILVGRFRRSGFAPLPNPPGSGMNPADSP